MAGDAMQCPAGWKRNTTNMETVRSLDLSVEKPTSLLPRELLKWSPTSTQKAQATKAGGAINVMSTFVYSGFRSE